MSQRVAEQIASAVVAHANCERSGNDEWRKRHADTIERIVRDRLPSGSGFDRGTSIDIERCSERRLVFLAPFHHMDENGYYDGWTTHVVTVHASFLGLDVRVSGQNKRDIKEYIGSAFYDALSEIAREVQP